MMAGTVSIGCAVMCFSFDTLDYERRAVYGGDAYTGIQNAAAMTSKNVKDLSDVVRFGFGSVLLVTGLSLIGFGLVSVGNNR